MRVASFETTPIEAVDYIEALIEGKVVCDVGAGDGAFAVAMSPYAKEVIGLEIDPTITPLFRGVAGVKMEYVNFMEYDFSKVEVIYCFLSFVGMYNLAAKLERDDWHGTIISNFYPYQSLSAGRSGNLTFEGVKPVIHVDLGYVAFGLRVYEL